MTAVPTGPGRIAADGRRPIVAVVTDAIHPYSFGGREIRYHELSRQLSPRADVHMYTMHWWDGPRVVTDGTVTLRAITPLIPLYSGRRRSLRQAVFFALACLQLLWRRFDVLHVDHIPQFQLFTMRVVATVRRKPLVATWHEVWGPEYWEDYLGRGGRLAWWIERLSMRLPDQIVAASAQTAERLFQYLGEQASIVVAPNGIDLEAVRDAEPSPDTTDLVVVTRMMVHKRLDMLLDAVALLHADGRPVTCRIIGDGPEREALHEQAAQLGIAAFVDFRHNVREQKEVYSLIKAGRIFAFCSEREGFGIAVLEALACAVPVVTTSSPDNLAQHLVTRSERGLVCEHTPEALALALATVLSAQDELGGEDPWLGEYDWNVIAKRIFGTLLP
jgi:glycosyltransferase involved in cell wall biosynthesis